MKGIHNLEYLMAIIIKASLLHPILDNFELYWLSYHQRAELSTISFEKLTVELDPLETQRMQETFHNIHEHYHTQRDIEEEVHAQNYHDYV